MRLHGVRTGRAKQAGGQSTIYLTPAGKKYIEHDEDGLIEGKILSEINDNGPLTITEIIRQMRLDPNKARTAIWHLKLRGLISKRT